MRNLIVELSPVNKTTGLPVVIRLASKNATSAGTILDGKAWTPVITAGPSFSYTVWTNGQPQALEISNGAIVFSLNARDFDNLSWSTLAFNNQLATVWFGNLGDPFSAYRKIYTGPMGPLKRSGNEASFELLGCEAGLKRPLLNLDYDGTGAGEGTADIRGNLKPWAMGSCINVAPVLVDPVYWIYQVDGYDACSITGVYELGISIAASAKASVASYAALKALALTPGEFAVAPTVGMFRLGGEPRGDITADIGSTATAGAIIAAMITAAGQGSKIHSSITNTTAAYDYYTGEQVTILDAAREIALHAGKYLIADANGVWHLADHISGKAPIALSSKRNSVPLVRPDTIIQEANADPAWRVKIGHTRVYEAGGEVSSALATIGDDAEAAIQAAQDAKDAADLAAADATFARQRVANQALDSVLDRTEKLDLVREIEGYTAERNGFLSSATTFGLAVEAAAYQNAYNALLSYLQGLAPAWNDTTADTVITSVYVDRRNAYLDTRTILTAEIAKRAVWSGVTGANKPQDNADVTAQNTAKDTAAVAGTPAATVITNVSTANTNATLALNNQRDANGNLKTYADIKAAIDAAGGSNSATSAAAEAARDAAQLAETNAKTARDQSQAARDASNSARDTSIAKAQESATSASNASGFATTASGQATIATQKATDAGTSATNAKASYDSAVTKAGEASVSASSAATSASDAAGSALSAATASGVAASAKTDAQNAASAASTSASSAAGSASAAGTSASSASESANTASTKAGQASTSASNAATSESNASGSANTATAQAGLAATSAGNAAGSASAANTSAGTASTKATEAGNSATAANAAKVAAEAANGAAQGAASSASTSAASADARASAAATSETNAASFREAASGHAVAASSSAAAANASASIATQTSILSASMGTALNANAYFSVPGYVSGIPQGWGEWSFTQNISKSDQPGRNNTIPVKMIGNQPNVGMKQDVQNLAAGWYVIEADVQCFVGDWRGSGIYADFQGSIARRINFGTEPDINQMIYGDSAYNRRSWSVLVHSPVQSTLTLHAMGRWTEFVGATTNETHWHKCVVRPATEGEIAGKKALADVGSVAATVTQQSGVIADVNYRTRAYIVSTAVAGNNRAQLAIYADSNGGAGVDIVGDVSISGNLLVGGTVTSGKMAPSAVMQVAYQMTSYDISIPKDGSSGGGGGGGGIGGPANYQ